MDSYAGITCRLAAGWNTWNTRSVLSHVLLPEGIAINIGFKHYAGGDYLKEALIGRRGEHDEKIHPGLRTYDGAYTDLRLSWKGCSWRVETAAAGDEWVMLVTPLDVAMPRAPLVVAEIGLLWNRPGRLSGGEGGICAETPARAVRLCGTEAPVEEPYVWAQGPYLALPADREVGFATGRAMRLEEVRARVESGRAARRQQGERWGEQAGIRDAMQTCLAWDTVYEPLHGRVISREEWFLHEVFDDLLGWNCWWPEHRQLDGLLAWGSHPYTPVVGNGGETHATNERFGAALESGLDNAPMYDDIPFDPASHLLQGANHE